MKWGSESAYIEAIASDLRAVTVEEVVSSVVAPEMQWQHWNNAMQNQWPHEGSRHLHGVLGATEHLLVRFLYSPKLSPTQALYQIEQFDPDLPFAIAGAILAAAIAERLDNSATHIIAALCARKPQVSGPKLSRKQIIASAKHFIADVIANEREFYIPGGGTNRARFWLAVGREVWKEHICVQLSQMTGDLASNPGLMSMATVATAWQFLQGLYTVEVAGSSVSIDADNTLAWPQIIEWHRGIPAEALQFLVNNRAVEGTMTVDRPLAEIADCPTHEDPELCWGVASALIREAQDNAVYIPSGGFVLLLPANFPLRKWGVSALRVWAYTEGLWVAVIDDEGNLGVSFGWQPYVPLAQWVVTVHATPLLTATLAALWHDLLVAGEDSMPSTSRRGVRQQRSARSRSTARTLPRRYIRLRGKREWGTVDDQQVIERRAHGVRGHLRQLPDNWRVSDEAQAVAAEFGLAIPDGYTFVRPHVRGDGMTNVPDTVIRSRGLMTVMSLL